MTKRQKELRKLCHKAEKISIDGKMFILDLPYGDDMLFLYDENGKEHTTTYEELEEDEQYGGKQLEFYGLYKLEDKNKKGKVLREKQWYKLLQKLISVFSRVCVCVCTRVRG